jgi:hypothetical protein
MYTRIFMYIYINQQQQNQLHTCLIKKLLHCVFSCYKNCFNGELLKCHVISQLKTHLLETDNNKNDGLFYTLTNQINSKEKGFREGNIRKVGLKTLPFYITQSLL